MLNNDATQEHINNDNDNITAIHTALSPPLPPPSVYVDYTPRYHTIENDFTQLFSSSASRINEISLLKEKREQYFKHLIEKETGHDYGNYMDSPVVRRDLGVNPIVAQINTESSIHKQTRQSKKYVYMYK